MRRALGAWKAARDRIKVSYICVSLYDRHAEYFQISEGRASKHLARQNDILVRAVMRVWKAHERGKLLERVKTARQLKQAWAVWKRRVRHQRALEGLPHRFTILWCLNDLWTCSDQILRSLSRCGPPWHFCLLPYISGGRSTPPTKMLGRLQSITIPRSCVSKCS